MHKSCVAELQKWFSNTRLLEAVPLYIAVFLRTLRCNICLYTLDLTPEYS